ncbi:MAG: hypothetical protein Q8R61_06510 [Thiobacillus sp.]|uniref:hypothetical protein n=1 Tax=Thiobacillus sp. TaxID=924 RepID=UPI00273519E3|nr:hypothetical protein [Thiobacillus sp.]MDP3584756.1 hypothetical protein [Thiobacillus sp.]
MKHPMASASVLVLALLLSACATQGDQARTDTSSSQQAAPNTQGDAAATVTVSQVTATVEAVDLATRMVTLARPDGKSVVVQAGEQVRNLAQVKVGDKVTVEYYEGLAAEIAPPGAALDEVEVTGVVARSPRGERPAGTVGEAIKATVVIEYVDTLRNVVHFTGPLGKTRIVKVVQPQFRAMLKTLKPGDQVTLTYFEAVAVNVRPASD